LEAKLQTVLITGGTGTFGTSYVIKAIENSWHKKIIVFSRDEFKQVRLARFLKSKFLNRVKSAKDFSVVLDTCEIRFFIGDVQDYNRLEIAMKGVDLVLHSAALKHVPICEYNPEQAVNINIVGALNVTKAAAFNGIKKVVALSTDKAADPINLYGATKLCLEKIFLGAKNYYHDTTSFHIVRYGNVIASRGSIIENLCDSSNKNFFLTDASMTRFWITIEEAIELTRFAVLNGQTNEIFVPKMKSLEMGEVFTYIRPDITPEVMGPRGGEKKHETMISSHDLYRTYDLGYCYGIASSNANSPLFVDLSPVDIDQYSSDSVERLNKDDFLNKVSETIVRELNSTVLK
tara:strand:- start:467 stop:1507 length:1041 start_codon:yes stop_codon:yes gene_type:complete